MLPAPDKSEVVIRWSGEDACYVASLPGFGPYAKTHDIGIPR